MNHVVLPGGKVVLRHWSAEDVENLQAIRNDVALQKLLMTVPQPNSKERVIQWLDEKASLSNGVFFVIAETAGGKAVGYIQVVDIDPLHRRGSLGICLATHAQGRGFGYEALLLLEPYLIEGYDLKKLTLQVLADNVGAIALYRKCGYREVGCLHEQFLLDDVFRDVLIMEKILS